MFDLAFKAGIPLLGVNTDDPANAKHVLKALTGKPPVNLPAKTAQMTHGSSLWYFIGDPDLPLLELHDKAVSLERQIVLVNAKADPAIFDAGTLMPPAWMVQEVIEQSAAPQEVPALMQVLKGLSLKSVDQIIRITTAKFGDVHPKHVRYVRTMLATHVQGLVNEPTEVDFYDPDPRLEKWVKDQKPYFCAIDCPPFLVPRGIMMAGPAGTGKTMGAKYIARELSVPLYRLDIAATLNRYLGEAEARVAQSLQLLDAEEPCVVLIDEVEKVFNNGEKDNAVINRILSQLLWWLQDHTSRVLTVMTTNQLAIIPPELWREGRVDMVLTANLLTSYSARAMAQRMLTTRLPKLQGPTLMKAIHILGQEFPKAHYTPAEVNQKVIESIKHYGWYKPV